LTLSIITVNFNQAAYTCAMLDSLRQSEFRDFEVLVVDNGSTAPDTLRIAQEYPEAKVLYTGRNLGFAGGNNVALPHTKGEYLFFVNNDTVIPPNTLGALVQFCAQRPAIGALSPLLCYYKTDDGPDLIQYAGMTRVSAITARNRIIGEREPDTGQFTQPTQTAYAHGAAMLIPRRVLDTVGPMDEGFFLYYEELDWCERIRRAGFEIWVNPTVRIYHKESITVGAASPLKTHYLFWNRIRFMRRNFKAGLPLFYPYLLLVIVPKTVLGLVVQGKWGHLRGLWRLSN
jgi:GT2 family glycosyltransferase